MNEMIWVTIGFVITLAVLFAADLIMETRAARK